MRTLMCLAVVVGLAAAACIPEYPNDDYHRNATNDDCISCHFRDVDPREDPTGSAPEPREIPNSHKDGDDPDDAHADCTRCHDQES